MAFVLTNDNAAAPEKPAPRRKATALSTHETASKPKDANEVDVSVQRLVTALHAQQRDTDFIVSVINDTLERLECRGPNSSALSEDQARFLVKSGDFTAEELADTTARVVRGDLDRAAQRTSIQTIVDSLSAAEVALLLGIDASRVRHRQAKGGLYSFLAGGKRRYPRWQFVEEIDSKLLPGLSTVIRSIPEPFGAASMMGFMGTPQEDLRVEGSRTTPVDWLLGGGDARAVAVILEQIPYRFS